MKKRDYVVANSNKTKLNKEILPFLSVLIDKY